MQGFFSLSDGVVRKHYAYGVSDGDERHGNSETGRAEIGDLVIALDILGKLFVVVYNGEELCCVDYIYVIPATDMRVRVKNYLKTRKLRAQLGGFAAQLRKPKLWPRLAAKFPQQH